MTFYCFVTPTLIYTSKILQKINLSIFLSFNILVSNCVRRRVMFKELVRSFSRSTAQTTAKIMTMNVSLVFRIVVVCVYKIKYEL